MAFTIIITILIFILLFYILLKVTKIIFKLAFIFLIIMFGVIVFNSAIFDRIKCEVQGGNYLQERLICNEKTKDYGKTCLDKTDCEGECIAEDSMSTSGSCSKYNIVTECNKYVIRDKRTIQVSC